MKTPPIETDAEYRLRLMKAELNELDRHAVATVIGDGLDEIGLHVGVRRNGYFPDGPLALSPEVAEAAYMNAALYYLGTQGMDTAEDSVNATFLRAQAKGLAAVFQLFSDVMLRQRMTSR